MDPDVQGGEPVVCGTRIPTRGLAKQIQAGETSEVRRQEYDYIDPDAFELAVLWASAKPLRGRPASPASASPDVAPADRAEFLAKRGRNETSAAGSSGQTRA